MPIDCDGPWQILQAQSNQQATVKFQFFPNRCMFHVWLKSDALRMVSAQLRQSIQSAPAKRCLGSTGVPTVAANSTACHAQAILLNCLQLGSLIDTNNIRPTELTL
jgi:hypothetical protein